MSSISPWRQFLPSIFEMEAMLPAPNAKAGPAKYSKPTKTRRNVKGDTLGREYIVVKKVAAHLELNKLSKKRPRRKEKKSVQLCLLVVL